MLQYEDLNLMQNARMQTRQIGKHGPENMSEAAKSLRQSEVQEPVQKRDLARRKNLTGDSPVSESPGEHRPEAVLLIHGTFANKAESPPAWWLSGSDFCQKLNSALSKRSSPARCWDHIGSPTNEFAWTGDNLEAERRIGGDVLAKKIMDLEGSGSF